MMGALIIKVFEGNWIYALVISFFNGQRINCFKLFLRYMLSNCRQKQIHLLCEVWILFFKFLERVHLFCEVWILFFSFLERLGYNTEQAESKWGCIKALHSEWNRSGLKYLFLQFNNFNLALALLITLWAIDSPDIVYKPSKSLENVALFKYSYVKFLASEDFYLSFRNEKYGFIFTEGILTLFSTNQSHLFAKSSFNWLSISLSFLLLKTRHVSWAYKNTVDIPLIYIENKKRPIIDPCSTLHDML